MVIARHLRAIDPAVITHRQTYKTTQSLCFNITDKLIIYNLNTLSGNRNNVLRLPCPPPLHWNTNLSRHWVRLCYYSLVFFVLLARVRSSAV